MLVRLISVDQLVKVVAFGSSYDIRKGKFYGDVRLKLRSAEESEL